MSAIVAACVLACIGAVFAVHVVCVCVDITDVVHSHWRLLLHACRIVGACDHGCWRVVCVCVCRPMPDALKLLRKLRGGPDKCRLSDLVDLRKFVVSSLQLHKCVDAVVSDAPPGLPLVSRCCHCRPTSVT